MLCFPGSASSAAHADGYPTPVPVVLCYEVERCTPSGDKRDEIFTSFLFASRRKAYHTLMARWTAVKWVLLSDHSGFFPAAFSSVGENQPVSLTQWQPRPGPGPDATHLHRTFKYTSTTPAPGYGKLKATCIQNTSVALQQLADLALTWLDDPSQRKLLVDVAGTAAIPVAVQVRVASASSGRSRRQASRMALRDVIDAGTVPAAFAACGDWETGDSAGEDTAAARAAAAADATD
eukprot:gene10566-10726_t